MSCYFFLDSDIMVALVQKAVSSEALDAHITVPFPLAHLPITIPYFSFSGSAQMQGDSPVHGDTEGR